MTHVLTALLAALVAGLSGHLLVATLLPDLIQTYYPQWVARHYAGKAGAGKREETVRLEPIDGRPGVSRVVLTKLAVDRLGIQTAEVVVQPVERFRNIGSVVLAASSLPPTAPAAAHGSALVLVVPLSSTADTPATGEPAQLFPLSATRANGPQPSARLTARPAGIVAETALKGSRRTAYYVLENGAQGLEPGDFVMARVPLLRNAAPSSVIPESAVIYEPTGTAWAYANPAPLVYVREPLDIEMTAEGAAVLRRGPAPGTRIVTVGAFELYGAESAIGIEKVGH